MILLSWVQLTSPGQTHYHPGPIQFSVWEIKEERCSNHNLVYLVLIKLILSKSERRKTICFILV